jgi:hypothetical protein
LIKEHWYRSSRRTRHSFITWINIQSQEACFNLSSITFVLFSCVIRQIRLLRVYIVENLSVRGYIHSIIDIDELLYPIPPVPYSSKSYISDPNNINGDQLWEPFDNKSLKTDTDNQTIENYPIDIIGLALTKYYSRSNSTPVKNVRIRSNINLAGRAWINTTIYGSLKYRTMMNETRRDNHYVMFNSSYIK